MLPVGVILMSILEIKEFFDDCAPNWDADMIRDDSIINNILDCGEISADKTVLDIACGTGVLFTDYLERKVRKIIGVDLSPEMVKIAAEKFQQYDQVAVLCQNAMDYSPDESVDCVMIYNAFPHFFEPERLIAHLTEILVDGGRLTIAHGMSREKIDRHHQGSASKVSMGLMHEDELANMMAKYLHVDVKISDAKKYIVSGVKLSTGG